jgi:hypothetical protein
LIALRVIGQPSGKELGQHPLAAADANAEPAKSRHAGTPRE